MSYHKLLSCNTILQYTEGSGWPASLLVADWRPPRANIACCLFVMYICISVDVCDCVIAKPLWAPSVVEAFADV